MANKKTKNLFVYLTAKNHAYSKEMRILFKSTSNYINLLISKDRINDALKKERIRALRQIETLKAIDIDEEK